MDSDSGVDDSGFMEGLKDLGLFDEDDPPEPPSKIASKPASSKNSAPSKGKAKSKPKPKPKRRPPANRPVLNFDDLLDGVDLSGPSTPVVPSQSVASASVPVPTPTSTHLPSQSGPLTASPASKRPSYAPSEVFISSPRSAPRTFDASVSVEGNLESYVSACFKALRDDFLNALERLLAEKDGIETMTNAFVADIKKGVRDALSVEIASGDSRRVFSAVEAAMPLFRDAIRGASASNASGEDEMESASRAQASVVTFLPTVKHGFRTMGDELGAEIAELRAAQAAARKGELKARRQRRIALEGRLELDTRGMKCEVESQTVRELEQALREFRRAVKGDEDEFGYDDEPEVETGARRMHRAIGKLRTRIDAANKESVSKIRAFGRRFEECRSDVSSAREMTLFSYQRFAQGAIMTLSRDRDRDRERDRGRDRERDRDRDREREREREPVQRVTFESAQVRDDPMLSTVRERLNEIQKRREADLRESLNFIKQVQQREKKRIRSKVDDI